MPQLGSTGFVGYEDFKTLIEKFSRFKLRLKRQSEKAIMGVTAE